LTGRRPAIDPIGLAQKTYEDYTNPNMKKGQATKNLVSNVANQLPYASTFTGGRIPIGSAIPNPFAVINGESNVGKELKKPLYYLLPPTGGGQAKKLIEGMGAYRQGASTTDSGRVRYPIPQTPTNAVRTGVFGQYSTPEAQQYFREGRNVLGGKQSQVLLDSKDKSGVYTKIISQRETDKADQVIKDEITKSEAGVKASGNKVFYWDAEEGSVKTLNLTPVEKPKLTGQTELDKLKISSYNSKITAQIKAVAKLEDLGQITATEAEKRINELTKIKITKAKKGKKFTIKKVKIPKIKLAKVKKIKVAKSKKMKKYALKVKKLKVGKIKTSAKIA
jgi:hypothetical protein